MANIKARVKIMPVEEPAPKMKWDDNKKAYSDVPDGEKYRCKVIADGSSALLNLTIDAKYKDTIRPYKWQNIDCVIGARWLSAESKAVTEEVLTVVTDDE